MWWWQYLLHITGIAAIATYFEARHQRPGSDVLEVPRDFVESVLYSGAFDRAQLDDLHCRAQELLDG